MSELTVEEKQDEKENKTIAGISTGVILSLLFVLMLFLVFGSASDLEDELESGGGVAVSLGEPDAGGPSAEASAPQTKKNTSAQEQVNDPVLSQDDDEAPTVKQSKKKPTKTPEKKVDSDLSDILGGLKGRKKTDGTGEGKIPGNNGRKDGKEGGKGDGQGEGDNGPGKYKGPAGISTGGALKGRRISQSPPKSNDFYTNGKVTLKVTVNSSGKVTNVAISRPSSNDPKLQQLAKDLAYKTKFEAKFGAAAQVGTMTFTFEL